MTRLFHLLLIAAVALCAGAASAQDVDLTGVKCPVKGGPAKADVYVNYNYGVVYLCCNKCKAAFTADMAKRSKGEYVTKANHQLARTGQFTQRTCVSGGDEPLNDKITSDVGGVAVMFSSEESKKQFNDAGGLDSKRELAFAYTPFRKHFKRVTSPFFKTGLKCFMMPKKSVRSKYTVCHNGGTVFLCCSKCYRRYIREPDTYAAQCNHQLMITGQFEQKKCPLSGGAADAAHQVEVAGVVVKLGDAATKAKVDAAADDKAKVAMLFSDERFVAAFAKKTKPASADDGK